MIDNLLTGDIRRQNAPSGPTLDQQPPGSPPSSPHGLPPEFWDAAAGNVKLEALLQAYQALERRLAQTPAAPARPEDYCVDCSHGLFESDPDINARLFEAGYSPQQAQLLYDLAAERLLPMLQGFAADLQAEREVERLVAHFGGEDKWRHVSRQLMAWGKRNLPDAAVEGLATTYDGVMALYRMMKGDAPATLKGGDAPGGITEEELKALMRDPRYWRDRDQGVVAKVTDGFRRLYPDQ